MVFVLQVFIMIIFDPPLKKSNNMHRRKKGTDQLYSYCLADQCLSLRHIDIAIALLPQMGISSFLPASVAVQPG